MSFTSYKSLVGVGDTLFVYLGPNNIYPIKVQSGQVFQTKYGALRHDQLIGKQYGSLVNCAKGFVHILHPTPELWTLTLPHRTQILYSTDISFICTQLDLKPGSVVCEAGTGSGSLSHAIARTIAPDGRLHTFDFHEERVTIAAKEFAEHGLSEVITVAHRDVCSDGFGFTNHFDALFLDLPHPWTAIPSAKEALKTTGNHFLIDPYMCTTDRQLLFPFFLLSKEVVLVFIWFQCFVNWIQTFFESIVELIVWLSREVAIVRQCSHLTSKERFFWIICCEKCNENIGLDLYFWCRLRAESGCAERLRQRESRVRQEFYCFS